MTMTPSAGPTVEPAADDIWRSDQLVDQVRSLWRTFDRVGGHFPHSLPALEENLWALATLTYHLASHVEAEAPVLWADHYLNETAD